MKILESMQKASKILATYTSPFIIAIAILTFFFPSLFAWVSGYRQTAILGLIMLSMGMTLTTQDFKILASRPTDILIGTVAQYTIMPCIAWSLCKIFHLDEALAIGIILVGCCPGGVSSNIMSYLCKGDVAFSIGMTTVSTILAPFVTPLLVLLLANKTVNVDAVGMFLNILIVTIIPILNGFLLNYKFGSSKSFPSIQSIMPGFGVICLACIVGGVISSVHGYLVDNGIMLFLWTFCVVFCHNSLGYVIGYMAGQLFHFGKAQNRTISIEVGMQNAGLATNLSTNFFMATLPLAVVPCAISCVWHSISGTLLAAFFMWREKRGSSPVK
ncbi:MAG: bile acid:sodium symporter family protein [Paludibacteraceae bacterium]|nr:bile acid:sodium symporter family protein [Paludibacteraceae bacterium]